jgi:hypothetical protein
MSYGSLVNGQKYSHQYRELLALGINLILRILNLNLNLNLKHQWIIFTETLCAEYSG